MCKITIKIPEYVQNVLSLIDRGGFKAYIVGGCVRDAILGITPNDWDIATSALPEDVLALFPNAIPTGIKHGTVTVRSGDQFVEVTTFRTEGSYSDHRHPDKVSFVSELEADLSRRDFTINAIAYASDRFSDPFNGIGDIKKRIIRCVGNAETRFTEDALRMFRAFRFSARFEFPIEDETLFALEKCSGLAANISAERVRDECCKILMTAHPEYIYNVIDTGLLDKYISRRLSEKNDLMFIQNMPASIAPRLAALCRILECSKCIDDAASFLKKLRLDNSTVRICTSVRDMLQTPHPSSLPDWKRMLSKYGITAVRCYADCLDAFGGTGNSIACLSAINSGECFSLDKLAINGRDLIASGFGGNEIGKILSDLLEYVIDHPECNSKEILISIVDSHRRI